MKEQHMRYCGVLKRIGAPQRAWILLPMQLALLSDHFICTTESLKKKES